MKKKVIFSIIIIALIIFSFNKTEKARATSPDDQLVGGRCTYDEFDGVCKVMNLYFNPEKADSKLVKFKFQPDLKLSADSITLLKSDDLIGTDQEGALNDLAPAKWNQHDKNQVQIGDVMSCKLKIENSGTCTPIIFSFSEILKDPGVYENMTIKELVARIVIYLIPIIAIIAFFSIKYKKFIHKLDR